MLYLFMKTLIVDNYDSFTFNLLQMVAAIDGELPVVVHNDSLTWQQILALNPDSIILSPDRAGRTTIATSESAARSSWNPKYPVLGVCLGFQGIAHFFGGTIERAPEPVHGRSSRIFHDGNGLFAGIPQGFSAVRYHSLSVRNPIPRTLRTTAWTSDEMPMALEHLERPLWGVQFHPESISTEYGAKMLENFRRLVETARLLCSAGRSEFQHRRNHKSRRIGKTRKRRTQRQTTAGRVSRGNCITILQRKRHSVPCSGMQTPAFWLDSAETSSGRFSFMGSADGPQGLWLSYFTDANRLELHSAGSVEVRNIPLFELSSN